jgi:hypothetical protein
MTPTLYLSELEENRWFSGVSQNTNIDWFCKWVSPDKFILMTVNQTLMIRGLDKFYEFISNRNLIFKQFAWKIQYYEDQAKLEAKLMKVGREKLQEWELI